MASNVTMPKLGMSMAEGVVSQWLVDDGAQVVKDQPIAEIMSDKITYELVAPADGVFRALVPLDQKLPVGATLAVVGEKAEVDAIAAQQAPSAAAASAATEEAGAQPSAPPAAKPEAPGGGFVLASPAARRLAKEKGIELSQVMPSGPGGMVVEADVLRYLGEQERELEPEKVSVSPTARRLAELQGVDLTQVTGTGVGGRVTAEDVRAYIEHSAAAPAVGVAPAARSIPFTGMRRSIAEHLTGSLRQTAPVTLTMEVDATELVRLREQLKAEFDLTYTDLLVKAVAKTLKKHPMLNSRLEGDQIRLLDEVHIGVAVALPEGLIVPVVRNADALTVHAIARETRRLVQAAREGQLAVDEVRGGTFTITNLGAYGIDAFTPIINAPEAGILGVGRIVEKPAIVDGEFAKRSLMVLSLTIDHRLVDGAPGAEFLRDLKDLLEKPYRLLI